MIEVSVSGSVPRSNGSGSGRPTNIRNRIRSRNTVPLRWCLISVLFKQIWSYYVVFCLLPSCVRIIEGKWRKVQFKLEFFHSHFQINLMKHKFFPCKKAYYVKRQDSFKKFILKLRFLWSRYGAGTGTITCQKSVPEPGSRSLYFVYFSQTLAMVSYFGVKKFLVLFRGILLIAFPCQDHRRQVAQGSVQAGEFSSPGQRGRRRGGGHWQRKVRSTVSLLNIRGSIQNN